MQWVHQCGLWFAWARCLLEWEHSGDIRGVGAGQEVSEGLGRAWKYVIFIANQHWCDQCMLYISSQYNLA
jgi:hypothetical protein